MIQIIKPIMDSSNQATTLLLTQVTIQTTMLSITISSNTNTLLLRVKQIQIRQLLQIKAIPRLKFFLLLMQMERRVLNKFLIKQIKQLTKNIGHSIISIMGNIQLTNKLITNNTIVNTLRLNQTQAQILNKYRECPAQERKILLINSLLNEERQVMILSKKVK